MNELVFLKGEVPFTTSLVIAEGTNNQHESIIRLIQNNVERFNRWGKIDFSDLKSGNYLGDMRGRPIKVANLNEQQATFLITLLRNNDVVLDFKAELVDQFFKMREALQSMVLKRPLVRQSSIFTFKDLMDAIHDEVIPAARRSGSTTPDKIFYINFNKLINKNAGGPAGQRDNLPTTQLIMIDQMQNIAAVKIRADSHKGKTHKEIYSGAKQIVEGYAQVALVAERFLLN